MLSEKIVCPIDHTELSQRGTDLRCVEGHTFPIVDDIPVFLRPDRDDSECARETFEIVRDATPDNYRGETIHPQIQQMVASTNGRLYSHLVGNLDCYPIPDIRLPDGEGRSFLDMGCNWGRWCAAAARKNYAVVGIDPHLSSLRAAKVMMRQLGLPATFICADGRSLPFACGSFDTVFSYSVIQHHSKPDAHKMVSEVARVLATNGLSLIQMPNGLGIVSLFHQARRGFRKAQAYDVRYWSGAELLETFTQIIGPSRLDVDGFFGLGIQPTDLNIMPMKNRAFINASEWLRRRNLLCFMADSLYVRSRRLAS